MAEKQEDNEGSKLCFDGNESFEKGDYNGALALYTKSLEKQETVDAFNNRAQTYIKLERYDEAITDCDSVLQMENDDFKAHGHKGIALNALGCFEKALKEFFWCLEREPTDMRFQQLHHECEKALDSKNLVDLTLFISFYPKAKTELLLVEGLLYSHMRNYSAPMVFDNLYSLKLHLDKNVSASLGSIRLNDVTVDGRLMQFFRSLRPATLRGPNIEYFNVNSSKADFEELFGGQMFAPMGLWFYQDDDVHYENHFFSALKSNKLPAIKGVKSLCLFLTEPKMSKLGVPFTGSQPLDIDSCIDFVHTEYPDIPAHVRRSSVFCQRVHGTGNRDMDVCDEVDMLRSYAGRTIMLDLRYLGSGKIPEIIDKCKKRFLAANHRISYSLHVRFVWDQIDPMDEQELMPLLEYQQDSEHVLRNDLEELLRLSLMPSVTPNNTLSKEEQSQVAKIFGLHIERVFG